MDRHEFLELCQRVSLCPEVHGVRKVSPELVVTSGSMRYYPVSYELTYKDGQPVHIAWLHDLKANSKTTQLLSDVEKCKGERE